MPSDFTDAVKQVEDLLANGHGDDAAEALKKLYETSGGDLDDASETLKRLQEAASGDLEAFQKTASDELDKFLTSFNHSVTDFSGQAIDTTNETIDNINIWLKEK